MASCQYLRHLFKKKFAFEYWNHFGVISDVSLILHQNIHLNLFFSSRNFCFGRNITGFYFPRDRIQTLKSNVYRQGFAWYLVEHQIQQGFLNNAPEFNSENTIYKSNNKIHVQFFSCGFLIKYKYFYSHIQKRTTALVTAIFYDLKLHDQHIRPFAVDF